MPCRGRLRPAPRARAARRPRCALSHHRQRHGTPWSAFGFLGSEPECHDHDPWPLVLARTGTKADVRTRTALSDRRMSSRTGCCPRPGSGRGQRQVGVVSCLGGAGSAPGGGAYLDLAVTHRVLAAFGTHARRPHRSAQPGNRWPGSSRQDHRGRCYRSYPRRAQELLRRPASRRPARLHGAANQALADLGETLEHTVHRHLAQYPPQAQPLLPLAAAPGPCAPAAPE